MMAIPSPPLWDMKPTEPGRAGVGAKVALSPTVGAVFSTPRQLGPITRIPDCRQMASSSRWRSAPASPVSAKPEEMTSSARTPAAAHSRATASTSSAGTTTTASSIGAAIALTEG